MLLYILEAKADPFHWRDVEAIPLYLFAIMVLAALFRVSQELAPHSQAMMVKAVLILLLVGLRFLAIGSPPKRSTTTEGEATA